MMTYFSRRDGFVNAHKQTNVTVCIDECCNVLAAQSVYKIRRHQHIYKNMLT